MNNTEVQGGSSDVASVLKYIAEREENLGKYSDKLRQSVQRIFDIFGDKNYCQICGEKHPYVGANVQPHEFVAKIQVSILRKDRYFFSEEMDENETRDWWLELVDSNQPLRLKSFRRWEQKDGDWDISKTPRRVLKALIKSGRLTAFMQDIADVLKEEQDVYKEVAEIAERMAQAISSSRGG